MKPVSQKLVLGTVQLGLPYGINNKAGKPGMAEAHTILSKAASAGIAYLDSAEAYGDAHAVIGSYLKNCKGPSFEIISKFVGDEIPLKQKVENTLSQLGKNSLYALMYHRFSDYTSGKYANELLDLRNSGKIDKIGVSLYSERELELTISDPGITVLQVPFNLFDASPLKARLLTEARGHGKEIHVRSVFLQGLLFRDPEELTGNLQALKEPLRLVHNYLKHSGVGIREACLNYALHQPYVDYVVIGVETKKQLEENLNAVKEQFPLELLEQGMPIKIEDRELLNPSNWKP